ncbi:MAG: hypothetical protein V4659_00775 [Pseudomonadota bacterium]
MPASSLAPVSRRRRGIALGLTLAVHVLLLLLFLNLSPDSVPRFGDGGIPTFDVAPERGERPTPTKRVVQRKAAARPTPPRPPAPLPPPPVPNPDGIIWLTKDQFAAADIAKTGKADAKGTETADTGADSQAAYGPGAGPGGQRLYRAEWHREPTNAELRTYLPPAPPDSWGEVACRTIANYHVENCQILGESPRGSGLATGVRRAAWQFLVRPPRLGGKPQIGTWVRIRIEFTQSGPDIARR